MQMQLRSFHGNSLFIICFIVCLRICSAANGSPPRLLSKKQSPIISPIGGDVSLQCPVHDESRNLFVEWTRPGLELDQSRHIVTLNGVLKIKSATMEDSGIYFCDAINGFGRVKTNLTLQIVDDYVLQTLNSPMDNAYPRDDNDYQPFHAHVNYQYTNNKKSIDRQFERVLQHTLKFNKTIGSSVTLKCHSSIKNGRWYKNGVRFNLMEKSYRIRIRKNALHIFDITTEDAANYTCIGHGKNGQMDTQLELFVYDNIKKPAFIGSHPHNITVRYGERAQLECYVSSDGLPHVQWLKAYTEPIESNDAIKKGLFSLQNQYYKVIKSSQIISNDDDYYSIRLNFDKTYTTDAGKYICLAINSHGLDVRVAFINVNGPANPTDLVISMHSSQPSVSPLIIFFLIVGIVMVVVIILCCLLCKEQNYHPHHTCINRDDKIKHINWNLNDCSCDSVNSALLIQENEKYYSPLNQWYNCDIITDGPTNNGIIDQNYVQRISSKA